MLPNHRRHDTDERYITAYRLWSFDCSNFELVVDPSVGRLIGRLIGRSTLKKKKNEKKETVTANKHQMACLRLP